MPRFSMNARTDETGPRSIRSSRAVVSVWDTAYMPSRELFDIFREGVCSSFMPWAHETTSEGVFKAVLRVLV